MAALSLSDPSASWPLWVAVGTNIVEAARSLRSDKISNVVTVGSAIAALVLGTAASLGVVALAGGLGSCLAAFACAFVILVVLYSAFHSGGGTFKLIMSFVAWVGCVFPVGTAIAASLCCVLAGVVGLGIPILVLARRHAKRADPDQPGPTLKGAQLIAALTVPLGLIPFVTW